MNLVRCTQFRIYANKLIKGMCLLNGFLTMIYKDILEGAGTIFHERVLEN